MSSGQPAALHPRSLALIVGVTLTSLIALVVGWTAYARRPQGQELREFGGYDGRAPLDPKTYRSPSNRAELLVDPSHPSGGGAANYRCVLDGEVIWSGRRPYTLCDVQVMDDGLVAGYAYAAGAMGGKDDAVTIALIAPDGSTRLEDTSPRSGLQCCTENPSPIVRGFFLDDEHDRLVVRVGTGAWPQTETWWTYSLTTGERGQRCDPRSGLDPRARWIEDARAVPGTPLTLVHWRWSDWGTGYRGAVFTLLDAKYAQVWRQDWPVDLSAPSDDPDLEEQRSAQIQHGEVVAVNREEFTVAMRRADKTSDHVTYAVASDARSAAPSTTHETNTGWMIREISRVPHRWFGPKDLMPDRPRAIQLEQVGAIELGEPSTLGEISRVTLGPADQIHAVDRRTGIVHVFDAVGALQHLCIPSPEDFVAFIGSPGMTVTDTGHVYFGRIHFGPDGKRIGKSDAIGRYAQRGSDRFWRVRSTTLELSEADGTVVRSIDRAPDGSWLRNTSSACVAPDGSIAVAMERGEHGIHIYSANGDPVRSISTTRMLLPWVTLAFDGERLAVGVRTEGDRMAIVLMDAVGQVIGQFEPHGDRDAMTWWPFFAAQSNELWLFDGERRVRRFALP